MSVERVLTAEFERVAADVAPDVDAALRRVTARHDRRRRIRITSYAVAGAAAIAAAILVLPAALDGLRGRSSTPAGPTPASPAPAYQGIAGTYHLTIPDRPGIVRSHHLAGRWTLTLTTAGAAAIDEPPPFVRVYGPATTSSFRLDARRFTTSLLYHPGLGCDGDGIYTWHRSARAVRFRVVKDDCAIRNAVLSGSWSRGP